MLASLSAWRPRETRWTRDEDERDSLPAPAPLCGVACERATTNKPNKQGQSCCAACARARKGS
eukprot:scaffold8214_cov121-Isochrysis_galbana.AAC.5